MCLYLLAIANNAVMNTDVQMSIQVSNFNSLGYIPGSGNAGLYSNSMFNFCEEPPYYFPQNFCVFKSLRLMVVCYHRIT